MDSASKRQIEEDRRIYSQGLEISREHYPNAFGLLESFHKGGYWMERENGFYAVRTQHREIVPINNHIPHGTKKVIKSDIFSFTLNQKFKRVMNECTKLREHAPGECGWMGYRMKSYLMGLHQAGFAHSVDIYREGVWSGGILGLQQNGAFIGISVCSRSSGAGNAGMVALNNVLLRHGFSLHDAIVPSKFSRHWGGELITVGAYAQLQWEAQQKKVALPEIPDKLSIKEYIKTPING
jgi:leucyl/phenylalanyl-tRNA--protein transferase